MNSFTFWNPTKLLFGRGEVAKLAQELANVGQTVLLVYGGGSVKKSGLYDEVVAQINQAGKTLIELAGVEPNPRLATVHRGVELCKKHNVDFLLAVGGGSVIDCTKAIAAGAKYDGDAWDFITRKVPVQAALPFGTVLTLAATGSEMNSGSVITNWETNEKVGWGSPLTFPKFSILDPVNTFTVPRNQTVYGIVDMMSHLFEQYFHEATNTPVQDRYLEATLLTVMETAPKLLDDLQSYEHREVILHAGTMALNGMLRMGFIGDWASHNLEHAVSAVYDIPHAGGLAILFPQWMRHVIDANPSRFAQLATRVFNVDTTGKDDMTVGLEGIDRLVEFWTSIGAPTRLADYEIDDQKLEVMVDRAMVYGPFGRFKTLQREDVEAIYRASL